MLRRKPSIHHHLYVLRMGGLRRKRNEETIRFFIYRGEWGPLNHFFYFQPVGYNFQRISRFLCAVELVSIAEQNVEDIIS